MRGRGLGACERARMHAPVRALHACTMACVGVRTRWRPHGASMHACMHTCVLPMRPPWRGKSPPAACAPPPGCMHARWRPHGACMHACVRPMRPPWRGKISSSSLCSAARMSLSRISARTRSVTSCARSRARSRPRPCHALPCAADAWLWAVLGPGCGCGLGWGGKP